MNRLLTYTVVLVVCKAWDLYTTWLRTPNLKRELNPLTRLIGETWSGTILQTILVVAAIVWFVRRAVVVDRTLQPAECSLSMSQFFTCMVAEPGALLYVLRCLTLFGMPVLFVIAGASNWCLTRSPSYVSWFNALLPLSMLLPFTIAFLIALLLFTWRDYSAYRSRV
jgi:hypothetical protein